MKKGIFSILSDLDNRIWGDQVNSNKYLATCTMLTCILFGVIYGGGTYIGDFFDLRFNLPFSAILGGIVVLMGLNIAESIVATDVPKIAFWRSLMMSGFMILGFVAGIVGSVILLAILTIIVGVYFLLMFVKMALGIDSGSRGGKKKIILDDGTVLTDESKDMLGFGASYKGSDGQKYHTDDGTHFTKE